MQNAIHCDFLFDISTEATPQ